MTGGRIARSTTKTTIKRLKRFTAFSFAHAIGVRADK
jgi:hypothetical protein